MLRFNAFVKAVVRKLSGCDIERFGHRSIAVIDTRHREDAWFSYRNQLAALIVTRGIDLVLDVGSNHGQFASDLRKIYPGEIHSFEPVSGAYEQLAAVAASDPLWHAHRVALGRQEGTATINVSRSSDFSSMYKANEYCLQRFGERAVGSTSESVQVRRLDTVLSEIVPDIDRRRIFLKMDTQGFDVEVFAGLGTRVSQVVCLQSEVSVIPIYDGMPHWTDSLLTYERAGFGIAGLFPVNRERSGRVIEYDSLMVRMSGV